MRHTRAHQSEKPEIPGGGRQNRRTRVLHGAQIDFYNHAVKVDCVIRDLSRCGARLETRHADSIPQKFSVIVNNSNKTYAAKQIWNDGRQVGIKFLNQKGN